VRYEHLDQGSGKHRILQADRVFAPHRVGWIGIVAAVFAGWLGLLSPLSSVIEGVSFIGFVAFFIFMASLGVALFRRTAPDAVQLPPVTAAAS
jgi:hypothetical protein